MVNSDCEPQQRYFVEVMVLEAAPEALACLFTTTSWGHVPFAGSHFQPIGIVSTILDAGVSPIFAKRSSTHTAIAHHTLRIIRHALAEVNFSSYSMESLPSGHRRARRTDCPPMKLAEALRIVQGLPARHGSPLRVALVCGFTPLHLQTFLCAELAVSRPERAIEIRTGLYGDLAGTLESVDREDADTCAIALEWEDLDPRLGLRSLGPWHREDIIRSVREAIARIGRRLDDLAAQGMPIIIAGPTLPLPPASYTPAVQLSEFETTVRGAVDGLMATLGGLPGVRIVRAWHIDTLSPPRARLDVRSALHSGFPYSPSHAGVLAAAMARLIAPRQALKGLITDLDNTLWKGIVGEVGASSVCWDLSGNAQVHGLYQKLLDSLARSGVLLAVASKNESAVAEEALSRSDLVVQTTSLYPREIHWGPKSASVGRILEAWNINADAVVFVDDSAMEIEEVASSLPALVTRRFPCEDPQRAYELIEELQDLFGKQSLSNDDSIRAASIRQNRQFVTAREAVPGNASDAFLRDLHAVIAIADLKAADSLRAFELVNKTNQFNLNGIRYEAADWAAFLRETQSFAWMIRYRDRFGPLGDISVVLGRVAPGRLSILTWVLSCRAFSRRIEYATLGQLFTRYGVRSVELEFLKTTRNRPIQLFIQSLEGIAEQAPVTITREQFDDHSPDVLIALEEATHV